MAAILHRLQSSGIDLPAPCIKGTSTWIFSQKIGEKNTEFFRYLVNNHQLLNIEYSIHCTQLAHDLLHKDKTEVTKQIQAALIVAELLEHIYRHHLNAPHEVARFRREQRVYHSLLAGMGYQFPSTPQEEPSVSSISHTIRDLTATVNLPRNFVARLRRFLVATTAIASDLERYNSGIRTIDRCISPVLVFASWICFVPRTITNLFLTAKHVLPGSWMSEQEKSLGWQVRLKAQMDRRWFELSNDIPWLIAGVLGCFVLTGALAPVGFYISAALIAYDILLASLRVWIEISRLEKIEKQYTQILQENNLSPDDRKQMQGYLSHLQQRITYEKKRLYIQVVNTTVVFLAFVLAFPILAFNPVIPIIGAAVAVMATIACYIAVQWVDKQKPNDKVTLPKEKLPSVVSHSMFKPSGEPPKKTKPELPCSNDEDNRLIDFIEKPSHLCSKEILTEGIRNLSAVLAENPELVIEILEKSYIPARFLLQDLIVKINEHNKDPQPGCISNINILYDKYLDRIVEASVYTVGDLKQCVKQSPDYLDKILSLIVSNEHQMKRILTSSDTDSSEEVLDEIMREYPDYADNFADYHRTQLGSGLRMGL